MPYSFADLLACADRETKMRHRVYERRVDAGQMSRKTADREIALMEEIGALLRALKEGRARLDFDDVVLRTAAPQLELPPAPRLELVRRP